MRSIEFGFEFSEILGMELVECREQLDCRTFDGEMQALKFPTNSKTLFSSVEDFISRSEGVRTDIWNKATMLDSMRRAVYGLDAVALVDSSVYQTGINDYEIASLKGALTGGVFKFIPIKKDNRNDSFLLINKLAAAQVLRNHPADFDEWARADIERWIGNQIVPKLQRPEPWKEKCPELQYGLLSGFPRDSVLEYPKFDALRKKYPEFARVYGEFIFGSGDSNKIFDTLDRLQMTQTDRAYLNQIVSTQAKFNDRSVLSRAGFIMLNKPDLHYGARRAHWFKELDRIYKPLMLWQSR